MMFFLVLCDRLHVSDFHVISTSFRTCCEAGGRSNVSVESYRRSRKEDKYMLESAFELNFSEPTTSRGFDDLCCRVFALIDTLTAMNSQIALAFCFRLCFFRTSFKGFTFYPSMVEHGYCRGFQRIIQKLHF